jgi:hypothetical protein
MGSPSLQEAFQACGEDLRKEEPFLKYYVAREAGASLELAERMTIDRRNVKALLAGQRGAGKTTELLRMAHDLRPTVLTLYTDVEMPAERAGIPDILAVIGGGMCRRLLEGKVPVSEAVTRSFSSWYKEALKLPGDDKGGLAGLAEQFTKLSEKLRRREGRPELAAALDSRREELVQRLNELAQEARARSGKEVLLIVDGLERLGKGAAVPFLLESGLLEFQFKCVCTVPFPVLHSPEFRSLRQAFDMISVMPLSEVGQAALSLKSGGVLDLRDMLERRTGRELIDAAALDMLLLNSGGNPGDLFRFTGNCCLRASMKGRTRIDAGVVDSVLEDHRLEMKRFLTAEEWQRLGQVFRDRNIAHDELLNSLLDSGAVLEYPGRRDLYIVHPALLPVLKERPTA